MGASARAEQTNPVACAEARGDELAQPFKGRQRGQAERDLVEVGAARAQVLHMRACLRAAPRPGGCQQMQLPTQDNSSGHLTAQSCFQKCCDLTYSALHLNLSTRTSLCMMGLECHALCIDGLLGKLECCHCRENLHAGSNGHHPTCWQPALACTQLSYTGGPSSAE